jgi:ribosome-binding protein aMBF1 (putative translation factor)
VSGWKLVGISDESTECEVCGRVELKSTHHIVTEDGAELRAGSSCAARKLGVKTAEVNRAAKVYRLRFQIARSNFPDYFRSVFKMSVEQYLRKFPESRAVPEGMYRRFMAREGFTI